MVTTRPPKTIVKSTDLGPVVNTDTKFLIYGLFQKGRVLAQDAVTRTCQATGEAVLVPSRNRRSKVDRITGGLGKTVEDETVAAGSVVALKRGNARGAKGPCCTQLLRQQARQG